MKDKTFQGAFELLSTPKEYLWCGVFLSLLLAINLYLEYLNYQKLDFSKPTSLNAQILLQYPKTKDQKTYFVLKLQSKGMIFYTTIKEPLKNLQYRHAQFFGKIKSCSFLESLRSCFFQTYSFSLTRKHNFKSHLRHFIDSVHSNALVGNLYRALFIGDSLNKDLRDRANALGINHLLAISGFHLGILSTSVYFLFSLFYTPLQKRYFPYRNAFYDIGVLVWVFLLGYLLLLDFLPSFFRAFLMGLLGFLACFFGVRILSFKLLILACCIAIALLPKLLFSVGFLLSVCGVWYIFLFLKHTQIFFKDSSFLMRSFQAIVLSVLVFLNMLIVAHAFFPMFSPYQLFSIPLGLIFIVFFPLSLLLHAVGLGSLLDHFLSMPLTIPTISVSSPLWLLGVHLFLTILSARFFKVYLSMNVLSAGFFLYCCYQYIIMPSSIVG
ncbi:ComEC/Rec2 family competence protein [Helicobacter pylori]|uniref:ComEC/Rec2 family competence protein n=1 Tax=Helicobacter pylori TaxID=210 RepID=UPI00025AC49C|nr:ComEC/Rec2 family competence protein [Helicobacter pylori]EIE30245.1 competence locus E [Helicobacter pylori NCTC 11637 = CCUG 17874 = ATCC 43504 = JCM 12093]MBM0602806.1 ComEC family DNA internalization-related competence protein [Helicobacter pylori]MBM0610127.1 ComEC family DNA internalization-related competence protein [Helicobacter pylori]MBM0619331.1 ComEC family DNA internalization-related competence protein [Helicobacter pylori]MBM0626710.1 ComEC family DNA internalization-related c